MEYQLNYSDWAPELSSISAEPLPDDLRAALTKISNAGRCALMLGGAH